MSCVRQTEGLDHSWLALWEVNGAPSFSKASFTHLFQQEGTQFKGVVGLRLDSYLLATYPQLCMMHVLFRHDYMCVGVGVCANVCVHECVIDPHPLLSTTQMPVRWS